MAERQGSVGEYSNIIIVVLLLLLLLCL